MAVRYHNYFSIKNCKLLKKKDIQELQLYRFICMMKSDYDNYIRRRLAVKYGQQIFEEVQTEFRHKLFAKEEQEVLKIIQREAGFDLTVYKVPGNYKEKHTKCDGCEFKDIFGLCFNLQLYSEKDSIILMKKGLHNENK